MSLDNAVQYPKHRTEEALIKPVVSPQPSGRYIVDESVIDCTFSTLLIFVPTLNILLCLAFPIPGTKVIHALNYGESLWGKTAKIVVRLPSGERANYFLKVCQTDVFIEALALNRFQ